MSRNAKNHAKAAQLERMLKGDEPVVMDDNYRRTLGAALNYYNANSSDKEKRNWFLKYLQQTNKPLASELAKLNVHEREFRTVGNIARMIVNRDGALLQEMEMAHYTKGLERLQKLLLEDIAKPQQVEEDAPAKVVVSIQQRIEDKARELASEIDGAIDEFVQSDGKTTFSAKSYLMASGATPPISKRIGEFYKPVSAELREAIAGTCEQLNEGYGNFTKRGLKKFADFIDQIIADCEQAVQTAKANRAPRKRKPVPLSKQVAKVKYLKEFEELKLKSVKPESMIEAKEVWIYNTKYRRIQYYKADHGLAIKGTTLIGFDTAASQSFTLRKPEEFFKGGVTKRPLAAALKALKTKPGKVNGRINEECIIVGAF